MSDHTPNAPAFKTCFKCGKVKPLTEFYVRGTGRQAGQPLPICKTCNTDVRRVYRAANPEKVAAYNSAYKAAHKEDAAAYHAAHLQEHAARARTHRQSNPEKAKARAAVNNAVRRGDLPPAWSVVCDSCQEAQAAHWHHHNGYDEAHWLDVVAACFDCHEKEHHAND